MKRNKLILSLGSIVASSAIISPVAALCTSCSCNSSTSSSTEAKFNLMKTTDGYCIDGLQNEDRSVITSITVPSTINGKKIVSISKGAFKGCSNLTSITLPFIGRSASSTGFEGLFGYIFGDEMYDGCGQYTWQTYSLSNEYGIDPTDYTNYAIPSSLHTVTINGAASIPTGAFSGCSKIRTVNFENCSATEIGNFAFYKCIGLKQMTIPSSVTTIGREAFTYCCNIKSMELPSNVTTIRHSAFKSCLSLTSFKIPTNVVTVGKQIFENMTTGLIMVEASSKPSGWDDEWINKSQSVVYDYHKGGVYYTNKCQVALCGEGDNKYAYVIQLLDETTGSEITLDSEVSVNGVSYPIKKIGQGVFSEYTTVTKVVLPTQLETIGSNCFYGCTELEEISFPSTLKTIGYCAFQGTKISKTYSTSSNETTNGIKLTAVETIEDNAFQNCTSLTNIDFGSSLKTIGNYAFDGCSSLVHLRDSAYVQNNILTFPKTLTSIGSYAFRDTAKLVDDTIKTDATVYGDIQFESGNTNTITIGESAFENMGVKTLDDTHKKYIRMCFDFNDAKVTAIPDAMFKNATLQRLVNLPTTITSIGEYAFYYAGITWSDLTTSGSVQDTRTIKLPNVETLGQYAFYANGSCTFDITGNSVLTTIGNAALAYCSYTLFTELLLPESVTSIGSSAFVGCDKLVKVNIPTNITRLEASTFNGCKNLAYINSNETAGEVSIPEQITYIGGSCFNNCQSLTHISVEGKVETIGYNAFSNCINLESMWYEDNFDSITSLGSSIYQNDTKLAMKYTKSGKPTPTRCIFPDNTCKQSSVSTIPSYTFDACQGMAGVYDVSSRYTSIGFAAFRNCTNLTQITGMESVKSIYQNAFGGCTGLTSVVIPDGCHTIGEYAFANCTKITELTLPVDITQTWDSSKSKGMGIYPFYGWTADQTIYFRDANLTESYDSSKLKIETWWGWTLERKGSEGGYYYTSAASGSSSVHFVFKEA